jgi:hypothetical protein
MSIAGQELFTYPCLLTLSASEGIAVSLEGAYCFREGYRYPVAGAQG